MRRKQREQTELKENFTRKHIERVRKITRAQNKKREDCRNTFTPKVESVYSENAETFPTVTQHTF